MAAAAAAEESRWALLVGIDDYIDSGISRLTGSVNDVVAIREALVTTAHFPSSQVFLLTSDDPGNAPTRGNIRARLDYIARHVDSDDLVYLHFSLHAVLDDDTGEGYLLTHRTDPRNVLSDGLPVVELREWLEDLAAPKRMLVLDGCRNDPESARGDRDNRRDERFSRGLVLTPRVAPSAATAFTQILFACSPGERAYEWPGRDRGLFSVALEEGLKGEADGPSGDGRVTLGELCSYVRKRVPELLSVHLPGKRQTPDVPDPPAAARSYALSDAQAGGGRLLAVDLPAVARRPSAAVVELEAVFARQAAKQPTISMTSVPSAPLTRAEARRVTLRWEADVDRAVKGYRYRLDDGAVTDHRRGWVDLSVPEPGGHTFQVQVQDHWDNWSEPARAEFTVLTNRRPHVSFSSPADGKLVRGEEITVQLAGTDSDGRIVAWRLALDDPDAFVESQNGAFTLPDAVDGLHTLFAQTIDDEGAASLWQSVAFRFRYSEPERDRPGSGRTTSSNAHRWTKGQSAPQVEGFTPVGNNAQGYPEYDKELGGDVTMRFVLVPAGAFTMGSPSNEADRDGDEGPEHRVTLDAFLIAKTECTQRQWQAAMGSNPSKFTSSGLNAPVEQVSWDDIQGFERKTSLSLPSEAQWEYAARAGSTGARHGSLSSIAWYDDNSSSKTHPVAQKQANAFGLHDVLGNVYEWCEDTWHASYSFSPTDGSAWVDTGSSLRVNRGGGWDNSSRHCRSANRNRREPGLRHSNIGFRPSRPLR
jgi:formylglycine-generating enzyme required for sulfatase activity